MKRETHREHWERVLGKTPPVYCSAQHITFGGKCLNCGWEPETELPERPVGDLSQEEYLEKIYGKQNLEEWEKWDERRR